jgi:ketosteroid isomerase-like protein
VIEYSEVFEETLLFGDTAVEWGRIEGAERGRGGPDVARSCVHVMRILRRQPDGSWRIHRTIFAPAPAPETR